MSGRVWRGGLLALGGVSLVPQTRGVGGRGAPIRINDRCVADTTSLLPALQNNAGRRPEK